MKVLMVTSSYPKFPGDVTAPFIESIAHALAARGHEVDVVLPHHPELRRDGNEPVRFLPYRYAPRESWNLWGYAQSLESDVRVRRGVYLLAPLGGVALRRVVGRVLTEGRHDVVHAHWLVPNAALVSGVAATRKTPLVVSLHGSDVFVAERLWPARVLARRALRHAGAVTACSDDLRTRVLALGAAPERTRVVPYGVDPPAAPRRTAAEVRAELGVPDGRVMVLALGRLVEKKGFRHLVEAAARVPGIHVVLGGAGDLRDDLAGRVRATGAPVTLAGVLDRDRVADALAAADVVAVPSVVDSAGNVDGLPNVLLEGLAAGRAVVASRVAAIPDVVEDGETGVLVPPGDVEALAAALRALADDPARRDRLGARARQVAAERYGWPAAARAFEECYAEAAALAAR
jgi:glycosyltransferase involved in cell wall biosynthesis